MRATVESVVRRLQGVHERGEIDAVQRGCHRPGKRIFRRALHALRRVDGLGNHVVSRIGQLEFAGRELLAVRHRIVIDEIARARHLVAGDGDFGGGGKRQQIFMERNGVATVQLDFIPRDCQLDALGDLNGRAPRILRRTKFIFFDCRRQALVVNVQAAPVAIVDSISTERQRTRRLVVHHIAIRILRRRFARERAARDGERAIAIRHAQLTRERATIECHRSVRHYIKTTLKGHARDGRRVGSRRKIGMPHVKRRIGDDRRAGRIRLDLDLLPLIGSIPEDVPARKRGKDQRPPIEIDTLFDSSRNRPRESARSIGRELRGVVRASITDFPIRAHLVVDLAQRRA